MTRTPEEAELLPCPFCNTKLVKDGYAWVHKDKTAESCFLHLHELHDVDDIAFWNARPSSDHAGLVEAIIDAYHTTRMSETGVAEHILSKPKVKQMLAALSTPLDREAIIRECAAVVDRFDGLSDIGEYASGRDAACRDIEEAILALIEQAGGE